MRTKSEEAEKDSSKAKGDVERYERTEKNLRDKLEKLDEKLQELKKKETVRKHRSYKYFGNHSTYFFNLSGQQGF